ncbi:hypothetical protein L6654_11820 [Bradyrhizobium sp. WYCCWR 13023]|uniref:Uncharacterized protein n=1 Tax=Bradyrhizobium zhengyangense TaxID=2911009 RepID=A0A9X1U9E1_9BRAD|nr:MULTISPECIES: hypothetical protein [Bradyrhizobium]MCG2627314.1 hypothetical protein [Bradyrhizobium zhengyangense]MCG2645047.1 hypothetical protein [Bradyrhizobium zhengyangense]MCG2668061.1 hypothetical protein [Bradyrhizobium zhengyangense]MDA9525643.1 hypothetical protein [Bradyrhizobium sp. CCBAU 11434]
MERDNVLQFPCPDHGLSSDEFVSELTRLCDELASEFPGGNEFGAFDEQLMRIEKSSILLASISQLVSRGGDRLRAAESFERIMRSVAELRSEIEGYGSLEEPVCKLTRGPADQPHPTISQFDSIKSESQETLSFTS